MICESNPIQNGGTANSSNWNNWFVPYVQKILSFPHIKGFIYISDPWDKSGFCDNWPDSRITSNSLIQNNYAQEMTNPVYIHMDEYLANPGIIGACTSGLLGDIDGDGMVNSTDALIALSFDAGFPIPQPVMDRINLGFGDANEDGLMNSTDALLILSFDSGIPVQFPVGDLVCL